MLKSKKSIFLFVLFILINMFYMYYITKMSYGIDSIYSGMNTRNLTVILSQPLILILAAIFCMDMVDEVRKKTDDKMYYFKNNVLCDSSEKAAKATKHPKRWKDSFDILSTDEKALLLKSKKTGLVYSAEVQSLIDINNRRNSLRLTGIFEITEKNTIKRIDA